MALTTGALAGGFGIAQGSTWNTAVAVGANQGLDIRAFRQAPGSGKTSDMRTHLGKPWGDTPDIGAEIQAFGIDYDLYYGGGCGRSVALIFGDTETPTNNTATYTHALDLQNSLSYFVTAVKGFRSGAKWHEWASAICASCVIEGAGQGRMTVSQEFLATTRDRDSATNNTTQNTAVTTRAKTGGGVYFHEGVFRINAQGGATLQTSDAVTIGSIRLEITRPLSQDVFSGAAYIAQPAEDGDSVAILTISLPSYDTDTYIALWEAATTTPTEQKADFTLSSGVTPSGGVEMTYTFQFPRLALMEPIQSSMTGPERVPQEMRFKCLVASSAPSGMAGVTQPVRLTIEDEESSAYLA